MKLAITSIAVTASICANASEANLLGATFMPFSLDLGASHRCPGKGLTAQIFLLGTPLDDIRLMTPQSANIDSAKID
jgi:hypothetical protein